MRGGGEGLWPAPQEEKSAHSAAMEAGRVETAGIGVGVVRTTAGQSA
jgi:hypothetical protein